MRKLILVFCIYVFNRAMADDTTQATQAAKTSKPTATANDLSTSPTDVLTHSTLLIKNQTWSTPAILGLLNDTPYLKNCNGWCFNMQNGTGLNIKTNETEDKEKASRFYQVKWEVEKYPTFPVRMDVNLYADKDQYADQDSNRMRSQLFDKNVVNIPTDVFFPYTKNEVKKAIWNSGYVYMPYQKYSPIMIGSLLRSKINVPAMLDEQSFTNSYFNSNPLLHSKIHIKGHKGRTNKVLDVDEVETDPYNINNNAQTASLEDIDENRQQNQQIQADDATIIDFVEGNKKRSKWRQLKSSMEVKNMIGAMQPDTIMDPPGNSVEDIVGGMKIKSQGSLFLIGTNKAARSKIFKWIGQKSRSKDVSTSKDKGIVVKGKSRARAIDSVLRSMIVNYQYGDRKLSYKKISS